MISKERRHRTHKYNCVFLLQTLYKFFGTNLYKYKHYLDKITYNLHIFMYIYTVQVVVPYFSNDATEDLTYSTNHPTSFTS